MTTVTATRMVPADPASTALLLAGPSALEFWPGISRITGLLSPLSARAVLGGDAERHLVVRSQPPRRTPTAYVTSFSIDADGLPSASGTLRVARQGWVTDSEASAVPTLPSQPTGGSTPTPDVAAVRLELHTDVDYDEGVEQEIAAAAAAFLDNLAAFASGTAGTVVSAVASGAVASGAVASGAVASGTT
jgi:hypothetical protein